MESDPVGHAVAFITANDPDGDMLWYKIEGLFAEFLFFAFSKFPSQLSSFFFNLIFVQQQFYISQNRPCCLLFKRNYSFDILFDFIF